MDLYKALARHYNLLFPLDQQRVDFTGDLYKDSSRTGKGVLDAGCGSGTLVTALLEQGIPAAGFDLSPEMIHLARTSLQTSNVTADPESVFKTASLEQGQEVFPGKWDTLVCLGNTLPHITDYTRLIHILQGFKSLLVQDSPLLLQLLNYDRILKVRPNALPDIETDDVSFFRSYRYTDEGLIEFTVSLQEKSGQEGRGSVMLMPWTEEQIRNALDEAGFSHVKVFADYKRTAPGPDDFVRLIEARG